MSKRPRLPKSSETTDRNFSSEQGYEVGRGKPPVHTRWKPGQSGNPGGRPKHSRNFATIVEWAVSQRITARVGDRARSLTSIEVIVLTMVNKALQGDLKSQLGVIQLMQSVGLIQPVAPTSPESNMERDADLIAEFLRGFGISINTDPSDIKTQSSPPEKKRKP